MPDMAVQGIRVKLATAVAVIGLVSFAVFALLSGTDRRSRDFPNSPSVSGWPYDTGAARARAISSFVKAGPGSAIPYAQRAILSDPLSIQAVSLLGRSQLYSGQFAQAHKTFEVSGKLGWRDPMTQMYWLDQSLQAGDFKVAAQRLDALLRQAPSDENRDRLLTILAAMPAGRDALALRLKLSPNWARSYLTAVSELTVDEIAQRVDVLKRTGHGIWDCPSTIPITQRLIDSQQLDEAQSVWRLNCGTPSSLVYDGEFDQLDTTRQAAAFDWQLSNRGDVNLSVMQTAEGNRLLRAQSDADVSVALVQQLIVLKPGRYRLSWQTPDNPGDPARKLTVSLSCKGDLSDAQQGLPDGKKPGSFFLDMTIGTQCSAQHLVFWAAPRSNTQLDRIRLVAL